MRSSGGGFISSGSPGATPSPRYVTFAPMTSYINSAGTVTYNTATSTSASTDTTNDWVAGFSSFSWLVAGVAIKIRSSGTIPTGLGGTTIYFAGKPTADRLRFYTAKADAIAGNGNYVDLTGAGTGNFTVYPAYSKDWSGQGNDLLFGVSLADTSAYAAAPYISGTSSASNDVVAARLDAATLAARWVWPTNSLIVAARVKPIAAVTAGRSIFGNGQTSPAQQGPRISIDGTTPTAMNLQFFHAGGTISCGTSAATVFDTAQEHHFVLLIDGPLRQATVWIDGARDLTLNQISLAAASSVSITTDLRFGGASATNAQASSWRDVHVLSLAGSAPENMDQIAAVLATCPYYRLRDVDI